MGGTIPSKVCALNERTSLVTSSPLIHLLKHLRLFNSLRSLRIRFEAELILFINKLFQGRVRSLLRIDHPSGSRLIAVRRSHPSRAIREHRLLHCCGWKIHSITKTFPKRTFGGSTNSHMSHHRTSHRSNHIVHACVQSSVQKVEEQ